MARATSSLPTPLSPRIDRDVVYRRPASINLAIVCISGVSPQNRNAQKSLCVVS